MIIIYFENFINSIYFTVDIEMQLVLDAKKPKSSRMFFMLEENRNVLNHSLTLDKNTQSCKTFNVYLKVRDSKRETFFFFFRSFLLG